MFIRIYNFMISYREWKSSFVEPVLPTLTKDSTYHEILDKIQQAISYLENTPEEDEDRVEFTDYGVQVKVWRTRINTRVKMHLGWKSSWNNGYYETNPEELADFLYQRRNA